MIERKWNEKINFNCKRFTVPTANKCVRKSKKKENRFQIQILGMLRSVFLFPLWFSTYIFCLTFYEIRYYSPNKNWRFVCMHKHLWCIKNNGWHATEQFDFHSHTIPGWHTLCSQAFAQANAETKMVSVSIHSWDFISEWFCIYVCSHKNIYTKALAYKV